MFDPKKALEVIPDSIYYERLSELIKEEMSKKEIVNLETLKRIADTGQKEPKPKK